MLDNRNVMYNGREWVVRVTFENGKVFDGSTVIDFEISATQDTNQIIGATQGKQIELNLLSTSDTNLNGIFKVEVGEYYLDKTTNEYKTHYFNLGQHWKVESVEQRDSQSVTITAVDPMVYLFGDDVYREGGSSSNITTSALITHIQTKYGITIEGSIPNVTIINPYLEKYRDILSYLGIIGSSNCFFKVNGMVLKYVPLIPKETPDLAIDGEFYYNIEYDRSEFTVKKVALDMDSFGYSRGEGSEDETIALKLPFATQEICDLIYNNLLNYTQEGIKCKFLAHPGLEPFDTLQLTDIYGAIHLTEINGYKLTFNGGLNMELDTQIMSPSNTTSNYVEEKLRTKIKVEADRILSIVEAEYAKKESALTVQPSKENIRIVLDEDMTPSKTESITIDFKVYRNLTTEEVPCVIKSVNLSDDNITASYTNTSNILTINANTDRVFTNTEGYIDVVIETTLGDIHKRIFWNATINTILNSILILSASTTVFSKENALDDFEPQSITINANCSNCELQRWSYSINGGSTFITATNGSNGISIIGNQLTIANNSALFNSADNVVIKAESNDGVSDTITIQRIEDIRGISVILDNENHSFEATSDGKAVATSINITVTAYKGTTQEPITIGSISGIPTGMSTVIKNNVITITVNTSMTTKNGVLNIPITCDGVIINKKFSYSLAVPGKNGKDGVNGTPGVDGTSSYFHIKYAPVINPSSSQMTETPSEYIGTYVDSSPTDSNNPSDYTWSKFQGRDGNNGKDGTPGVDGKDGTTYYLHIKYSNDGSTFTSNNGETPGDYLGQYVDTVEADSTTFSKYTWSKIKGEDGKDGTSASYVNIMVSNQVFLLEANATAYTPSSITLTPIWTNSTYSKWQYSVDNGSTWTNVTSGSNGLTISNSILTIANTCSLFTDSVKSLQFKVIGSNNTSDTITIIRIKNGVDGANGTNGKDGKGIKSITNYYLATSLSSDVTTSTSGWTTTVQNMTTTNKYLWNYEKITYSDSTSKNTTPCIIGVHGTNGTNGTNGQDGKGIKSITEYYLVSTAKSGVTTSTSGWSTDIPTMTATNKYLWNYEVITYTDNSSTTSTPKIIGAYGDKGNTGTSAVNVILGNENHTFIATSNGKAVESSVSTTVVGYKGTTLTACTIGTISGLPTGMTATISNNGTTTATISFAVTTSMVTKNGVVTVPVTCGGVTINKYFSYSLAIAGTNGTSAKLIKINATANVFKSTESSTTYSPSSIILSYATQNVSFSKWQYSTDGGNTWTDVTSGNNGLTISSGVLTIANTCNLYTDSITSITFKVIGSNNTYDVITIPRLKDGKNAISVILSNESHTFDANYEGFAVSGNTTTKVYGYLGTTQKACTIGTISGLPTGMTAKINNNGTTTTSITFTVATTMTSKNGVVTIPVTCNGITINKLFSYSLSLDGTPASSCKINAPASVFLSDDGGTTYSPSTITFTGSFIECSFSKWQYLDVNTSTFKNVVTGEHGFTLSSNNLILAVTSDLFNEKGGAISIRLLSNKNEVYDTLTISKLVQIKDLAEDIENIRSEIQQTNHNWKASFSTSNATNILFDGDFEKEISKCNFAKLNSSSIEPYYATVNGYPFYENHNSLNTTFKYNTLSGVVYSLDLSLKPDTDYVFQAYIYVDNANIVSTNSTSPLSYWTWTGETPKNDNTNTSSIIDYSQILYTGRYNLCYIHFKTKAIEGQTIKCRLFIRSKSTSSGNQVVASIRQVCFRERDTVAPYTGNSNEIIAGVTTIDMNGIQVEHTLVNSKTEMSADGFRIIAKKENSEEVIAELSNEEQWTKLKVDKVFAKNIENIYEGSSNLYVDHSATVAGDGSANKPFNSFADLQKYLELTPMINKDIWIYVTNPGFEITEQFCLHSLKGSGFIQISFDAKCVLRGNGTGINRPVVRLYQIAKRVLITGNRSSITASDGLLILDDTTNGRGMGIYATDITKLELDYLTINCSSNGIRADNCDLYTYGVDFGKCACDVELRNQSLYYSSADCGSSGIFCKIYSASKGFWGNASECQRPTGDVLAYNGLFYSLGNATTKNSCRFGSGQSTPTPPAAGQQQSYTYSYNWTSHKTYCYSWSNWNDSNCKQGQYGGYGLRGGHMFFDMAKLRSEISGEVLDGNTITLTRANNGGNSGGAKVYINGSSCSSPNGTPSYGDQTLLGTLAWGETKTFTLPKAIVQGLKNGTYNSLAVYVNSSASDCYLNIVNCSITLKCKK